jgi:hypothetical protein
MLLYCSFLCCYVLCVVCSLVGVDLNQPHILETFRVCLSKEAQKIKKKVNGFILAELHTRKENEAVSGDGGDGGGVKQMVMEEPPQGIIERETHMQEGTFAVEDDHEYEAG